ncbi:MAG: hypothetical protein UT08_C0003G0098 [Candidatus Woesebacteria bacterium GW2011_GWB1_38_8]|uniref:Uncharacterized protein n=1 Tax=Candidatus Woesebacteria bacterium GW2011_GWB1_38_8 TaxID=1618570 RepID=A0A0G0LDD6_9BACT|nr:MAG: hypothetical protein UT08_C0003G0098 [Candidatus Woesebacteria bacterium GW2011_GWB1_38_8]
MEKNHYEDPRSLYTINLCLENEGFLLGKFGGCSEAVSRQFVELELGAQLPSPTKKRGGYGYEKLYF